MKIDVSSLCFSYSQKTVLQNVDFQSNEGDLVAFLGPNGVGKTTFFRCLLGFLRPESGSVKVNGKDVSEYTKKELAREIAYIPQSYNPAFNHNVLDCVLMGSASQVGLFEQPGEELKEKALGILAELGIEKLAYNGSMKISGGERQLMLIARALMQDAHVLIMDEPTANLDFGNSFRVMQKIKMLAEKKYTVLFSTHDPAQALRYSNRIVAMKGGKIISNCPVCSFNADTLNELYGVETLVCEHCKSVIIKI